MKIPTVIIIYNREWHLVQTQGRRDWWRVCLHHYNETNNDKNDQNIDNNAILDNENGDNNNDIDDYERDL